MREFLYAKCSKINVESGQRESGRYHDVWYTDNDVYYFEKPDPVTCCSAECGPLRKADRQPRFTTTPFTLVGRHNKYFCVPGIRVSRRASYWW